MLNVHRTSVIRLMQKYSPTGSVGDRPRQARSRVTTRTATETSRVTIGRHGHPISAETVRRRLRENGIRCRRPFLGIALTDEHKQARLRWARRHERMTRADWAGVLFTDESRFNLYENDGRVRVYRRVNERFRDVCVVEKRPFGGGSVMIWGGISVNTKTACVHVNGNLNADRYIHEVLLPVCVPHLQQNRGMRLLQDGAPCHTARRTAAVLAEQRVNVLPMPSRSPDLNPIEHVWDVIGKAVRRRSPRNLQELRQFVEEEWQRVSQATCRNFVLSMRNRCRAVIATNGGYTQY